MSRRLYRRLPRPIKSSPLKSGTTPTREKLEKFFDEEGPILVEIHFCGTSPDWFLCNSLEELDNVTNGLWEGVEFYLTSVWDMPPNEKTLHLQKWNPPSQKQSE
jgi:hypothetical protein